MSKKPSSFHISLTQVGLLIVIVLLVCIGAIIVATAPATHSSIETTQVSTPTPDPHLYTSPTNEFTIWFPSEVKYATVQTNVPGYTTQYPLETYASTDNSVYYLLSVLHYKDIPNMSLSKSTLDKVVSTFENNSAYTNFSASDGIYQGYITKNMDVDKNQAGVLVHLRGRFIITPDYFYELILSGGDEHEVNMKFEKFSNSLHINK